MALSRSSARGCETGQNCDGKVEKPLVTKLLYFAPAVVLILAIPLACTIFSVKKTFLWLLVEDGFKNIKEKFLN